MAFPDQIKFQRYKLAGGQCECVRLVCGHFVRCTARLAQPVQSQALTASDLSRLLFGQTPSYAYPGFEFNHRQSQVADGSDSLANCEFLCTACHQNTRSYGTNLTRR
jgi:hypothetical protein